MLRFMLDRLAGPWTSFVSLGANIAPAMLVYPSWARIKQYTSPYHNGGLGQVSSE